MKKITDRIAEILAVVVLLIIVGCTYAAIWLAPSTSFNLSGRLVATAAATFFIALFTMLFASF